MAGGPFVNLVIAVFLFTVVLSGIGVPTQTLTVSDTVACVPATGTVAVHAPRIRLSRREGGAPGRRHVRVGRRRRAVQQVVGSHRVRVRSGRESPLTVVRRQGGNRCDAAPHARARAQRARRGRTPNATETVGFMGVYSAQARERQPIDFGLVADGSVHGADLQRHRAPAAAVVARRARLGGPGAAVELLGDGPGGRGTGRGRRRIVERQRHHVAGQASGRCCCCWRA